MIDYARIEQANAHVADCFRLVRKCRKIWERACQGVPHYGREYQEFRSAVRLLRAARAAGLAAQGFSQ